MEFTLLLATAGLAIGLAAWVFLHHEDLPAALVAVVIAIAALGIWSSGDARREELRGELQEAHERIAVLEATPAQRGFSDETRAVDRRPQGLSTFVGPSRFRARERVRSRDNGICP